MSYSLSELRRWSPDALAGASAEIDARQAQAADAAKILSDGRARLDEGWDGVAADAVLDAADGEGSTLSGLSDGLDDLADALSRAQAALSPAVGVLTSCLAEAEAAGLVVDDTSVRPAPGRDEIDQATVDEHARAVQSAVETVRSLDQHYGGEIDAVAAMLAKAIPPLVDRSPIPGPDEAWKVRVTDAVTGAAGNGFPTLADDIDPRTRGRHLANPFPDDLGRLGGPGLRALGRLAGPLGAGLTVYDGVDGYLKGETTAAEAAFETTGTLAGGAAGGAALGATMGMVLGPVGAIVGGGIGAAAGAYLGQGITDQAHEYFTDDSPPSRERDRDDY